MEYFLISFLSAATTMGFSIQTGSTSSYLISLGVKPSQTALLWLFGPISGILIQPIFGYFIDRTQKRKFFLVFGSIFVCLFLYTFTYGTVFICIFSFIGVCFSLNIVLVTQSSLITLSVSEQKQTIVFVMSSICGGLGNLFAFFLGSIPFSRTNFYEQTKSVFYCANILYFVSILICFWGIKEPKPKRNNNNNNPSLLQSPSSPSSSSSSFYDVLFDLPSSFYVTWLVQFFSYGGKFLLMVYGTDFIAKQVFEGDPIDSPLLYQQGVAFANKMLSCSAFSAMIYGLLLSKITKKESLGLKNAWRMALFLEIGVMLSFIFNKNKYWCVLSFICHGIVESSARTIPWTIVNLIIKQNNERITRGEAMIASIFNLSQCVPQLLCSIASSFMIQYLVEEYQWNIGIVFALGFILGLVAFGLAFELPKHFSTNRKKMLNKNDNNRN